MSGRAVPVACQRRPVDQAPDLGGLPSLSGCIKHFSQPRSQGLRRCLKAGCLRGGCACQVREITGLRFASHVRYIRPMRTAALPPIRVEPEFRSRIESVLEEGETLSSLVESAVRQEVTRRVTVAEFHKRGFETLAHA
ncbi:MAG: YlcI/YnfO family protein, partial [Hydrogenophaga sp.]|nr:YlcI/YnfO family protein [Hydrogenophaga sp.]